MTDDYPTFREWVLSRRSNEPPQNAYDAGYDEALGDVQEHLRNRCEHANGWYNGPYDTPVNGQWCNDCGKWRKGAGLCDVQETHGSHTGCLGVSHPVIGQLEEHRYVEVVNSDGDDWYGCICGCPLVQEEGT